MNSDPSKAFIAYVVVLPLTAFPLRVDRLATHHTSKFTQFKHQTVHSELHFHVRELRKLHIHITSHYTTHKPVFLGISDRKHKREATQQ